MPSVGGMGPEKTPVAGLRVGIAIAESSGVPSPPNRRIACTIPAVSCPDEARGVMSFVNRGDSNDDGPERIELRSKAVTA